MSSSRTRINAQADNARDRLLTNVATLSCSNLYDIVLLVTPAHLKPLTLNVEREYLHSLECVCARARNSHSNTCVHGDGSEGGPRRLESQANTLQHASYPS